MFHFIPDRLTFIESETYVKNTEVFLSWQPASNNALLDSYILECSISSAESTALDPKSFFMAYRGNKTKHVLNVSQYNSKVSARVKAVNVAGEGPSSDPITLTTSKGKILSERFIFQLFA